MYIRLINQINQAQKLDIIYIILSFFQHPPVHFDILNDHYQLLPVQCQGRLIDIKSGKVKHSSLQFLVVNDQSAMFQVQYFHDLQTTVDKNENFPVPDIPFHDRGYNAAERVKTLPAVNRCRIQVILQFVVQMEHPRQS